MFEDGNFDYVNKNKAQIIADSLTPFDDFYANGLNFEHTQYEDFYSFMEVQEIMFDNLYLQDKQINKSRDFEAQHLLVAGRDVQPDEFTSRPINQSSLNKIIQNHSVTISNNAIVTFRSGSEIKLKDGFEVKAGAYFTAKTGPLDYDPACDYEDPEEMVSQTNGLDYTTANSYINKVYPPYINGNTYVCGETTYTAANKQNDPISWHLVGENTDIYASGSNYTTPLGLKPGQYTLYAKANGVSRSILIEVSGETKCQTLQQLGLINQPIDKTEINIFPNPASTEINIKSNEKVDQYSITDALGKVILSGSSKSKIDISSLKTGIYFVSIQTKNKTQSKQFIKN